MPAEYSGHFLIPHLNVLQKHFLDPLRDQDDRFRATYFDLELLPYTIGAAWFALAELARVQHEASTEVKDSAFADADVIGLTSAVRDRLTFAVDGFLDAARRAQNAVIAYLGRGLKISLPRSMSELIKKLRAGKLRLPSPVKTQLLKYWDSHGQRLKNYRDLAQHHALITSDARLFRDAENRRALYFVLPSNPEVKSAPKLQFGTPAVHAFPYLVDEFLALVGIIHWLTAGLVPSGVTARMALVVCRDAFTLGVSGHLVPNPASLAEEINRLQAALHRAT